MPKPDPLAEIEQDWLLWLATLFPGDVTHPFASFHQSFWEWLWSIRPNARAEGIECWARDSGKTTSLELAIVRLATTGRRYGLYVSRTQDQADAKIENAAAKLGESDLFALFYPEHADRKVSKYGHSAGWRRNRLRTAGGFTLDAAGLDRAVRGLKVEEDRPDVVVIDDIDEHTDTALTITKHEQRLSRSILPARSRNAVVLFKQNLIHENGVMARLLDRRADYLRSARRVGPIPAIEGLAYEADGDRFKITAGEASWPGGFGLERAEAELNASGPTAFLAEHQHEPQDILGDVFGHMDFAPLRVKRSDVPPLDIVIVRVDPAVEGDADSGQGACAVGRDRESIVYFLSGYEGKSSPLQAIKTGIRMALAEQAHEVGIEDVQGKKTWESVWREAVMEVGGEARGLQLVRVGVQGLSKPERVSQMVADFELGRVRIVEGSHHVMEGALHRFPAKPNDLADAMWHGWQALRNFGQAQASVAKGSIQDW